MVNFSFQLELDGYASLPLVSFIICVTWAYAQVATEAVLFELKSGEGDLKNVDVAVSTEDFPIFIYSYDMAEQAIRYYKICSVILECFINILMNIKLIFPFFIRFFENSTTQTVSATRIIDAQEWTLSRHHCGMPFQIGIEYSKMFTIMSQINRKQFPSRH